MNRRPAATHTINVSEARQQFSQVLNEAFKGETRVIVVKTGIPVAGMISARDLERFERLERERAERFRAIEESWPAFRDVPIDEIEDKVAEAVAAARRKRRPS